MKKLLVALLVCSLLVVLNAQAWAAPPHSNPIIHYVQWGENLTNIARRYGTTIQAIMYANGIYNPNRIYAGQRLIIPVAAPAPAPAGCVYTVRYGDTISGIAYKYGVSISAIMRANRIINPNRIYAGQRLVIPCAPQPPPAPAPGGTYYTVQRGDTLAKIAMRFGVSTWSIVQANNLANPHLIYPGQRLYIPGASAPTPTPAGPGCDHLTWPTAGASLTGVVQVKGTAKIADFWYYKLEYRKDGLDDWHYITGAQSAVENGVLGEWDTRSLASGAYLFRVVIVDRTGNYPPPCEIAVQVDNDP